MALQLGALRDAFLAAGVTAEWAAKAAEEVAAYERDIAGIRSDLRRLTWMVGILDAALLAILVKLYV